MKKNYRKGRLSNRMRSFIREQSLVLKPSSLEIYQSTLPHFYRHLKGSLRTQGVGSQRVHPCRLAHLTADDLKKYLFCLTEKKIAPQTVVHRAYAVKRYLLWEAERERDSAPNFNHEILKVFHTKNLPKIPEYLPRPLSDETDRKLQDIWRNSKNPYAPFFLLLRATGMRVGELIDLPWDCVATLSHNEHYLKIPLGKLNNERLVPLHDEALGLIQKIKANDPFQKWKQWGFKKKDKEKNDTRRLIHLQGRHHSIYCTIRKHFKRTIGNLADQQKPVTFHRLRHTYATSLLAGGISITSIMKLLGHRKIKMTLRYARVTPSLLRNDYLKAMKNIENNYGTKQEKHEHPSLFTPAGLFHTLVSFVDKAITLKPHQKKNLRLRLARLEQMLAQIVSTEKLKLPSNGE